MNEKNVRLINEILNLPTPCMACVELKLNTKIGGKGQFWVIDYIYTDQNGTKKITKTDEFWESRECDTLEVMLVSLLEELK